jgi:hypothetical protein
MVTRQRVRTGSTVTTRPRRRNTAVKPAENGRAEIDALIEEIVGDRPLSAGARAAFSAFGAWSDMDWEETLEALDRIRHESKPTPPIEDR